MHHSHPGGDDHHPRSSSGKDFETSLHVLAMLSGTFTQIYILPAETQFTYLILYYIFRIWLINPGNDFFYVENKIWGKLQIDIF